MSDKEYKQLVRSATSALMSHLGCAGVVSEGMCEGETFCVQHGQANDVGYGWKNRQCLYAKNVVKGASNGVLNGDWSLLADMIRWVDNG